MDGNGKTLSGASGGSLGKSVGFHDAILAELRGPEIPKGAKTARDYMLESGAGRTRVQVRLTRAVAEGEMLRGEKVVNGRKTAFYWPASR